MHRKKALNLIMFFFVRNKLIVYSFLYIEVEIKIDSNDSF